MDTTEQILAEINRHALVRRLDDGRWLCRCGDVYVTTHDRDISPKARRHLAEALAQILADR